MSQTTGVIEEVAGGVKSVLGRLSDFFHIFDLSFFVGGAVAFGAVVFVTIELRLSVDFPFAPWVKGLAIIVACYVLGLVCFAVGRPLNRFRNSVLTRHLRGAIDFHKLRHTVLTLHPPKEGGEGPEPGKDSLDDWRIYIRLWQELVARHSGTVAFSHLTRYWVMAATYDSLAVSLFVWSAAIAVAALFGSPPPNLWQAVAGITLFLLAGYACFQQGRKYYEYQVEDLVAALASVQP